MIPSSHFREVNKLITLWIHEIYQVFHDRLVDDNDRSNPIILNFKNVFKQSIYFHNSKRILFFPIEVI
jgi:hypothetical protein